MTDLNAAKNGCFICQPDNSGAADEGCLDCEARYVNQVVIPMGVAAGEQAPDYWLDYETVFGQFSAPHRGGVLSERERNNPKITQERLRKDARALLWQLHWACSDLVSARSWGHNEATEAQRLRERITELFSLLTDGQKAEMLRRDEARRTQHIEV